MCEQPPVIRWGRTQRAHVRTTAGYSHMKGRAQADNRQLVAQGRVRPRGPCANNRRLFEHGRVEHVRRTAGYSHVRTREALCEQPPVPRKCKGPQRPCANSRVLFAHGRVRGGRLYAHARVGPRGAMCEQQPVICTHPFMCNLGSERQGAMCEQLFWSGMRGPCANNRRLFAHGTVSLVLCHLSPDGKGPSANNRRLFEHERSGPRCHVRATGGYSHMQGQPRLIHR